MIPYGRQSIDQDDIDAVVDVLSSDWLTTGPLVKRFEDRVAEHVGTKNAIAVSSGTAALHCIMHAIGIGPGDEVIVPPMTFCATANAVLYQGGIPVFVDVEEDSLLIDAAATEAKITDQTKAIVAVDYAGQPCDYDALRGVADKHGLILIADGCHALGGEYKGRPVGVLADLTAFSFHPVKHITTGEGGMVTTDDDHCAARIRAFRNHGIAADHRQRNEKGTWFYEMTDLGHNYRLTDIQCALGLSQLQKLHIWIERRNEIAENYDRGFANIDGIDPLHQHRDRLNAYHLYVVRVAPERYGHSRDELWALLRAQGIQAQVHYIPVHHHPYYRDRFGFTKEICPLAAKQCRCVLSLPMYPTLDDADVAEVIHVIRSKAGCGAR